ncbi:hypothetical protein GCM10010912_39180 [Paenibacillus albidus]|uniref:Uncharacterized protein n=1 Tax=Paenibacillus albidus TaxID=2041023 RepID=A0A917FMV8_9BACL|nr:STM3941 family protein [Paenibacillus albidus]GGF90171.1 hypothetical protein GCM10010912_39180 [Paenibacillus albidus]
MNTLMKQESFKVYTGKRNLWLMALAGLAFVAAGVWMISLYLEGGESILIALVGLVCTVFFGACLLYIIKMMFDRGPAVILDEQGVTDHSSFTSGGTIRWDEIENLELFHLSGQKMIGIQLKDPQAYLANQRGFKGWLMRVNHRMVDAPVNIAQAALPIPLEQLYEEMLRRWELHRQDH